MARPKEFEDLTTTSLTVGRQQLQEGKERGLNLSDIFRDALNSALKTPVRKVKEKNLAARIKKKIRGIPVKFVDLNLSIVAKNPGKAGQQANFMNARCNTSLTGQDLLALVPTY